MLEAHMQIGARVLCLVWLGACGPAEEVEPDFDLSALFVDAPAAGDWGSLSGPGMPTTSFEASQLWEHCAYLTGGPNDAQHHNLVVMWDGYLLMPWAPEEGDGGLSIFDISDPCDPIKIGELEAPLMRETHSIGISIVDDRTYAAVNYQRSPEEGTREGGVGFIDITDLTAPVWVSQIDLPNYYYPDAYLRVVLSVFWQGPRVYASMATNGVWIIDASDPLSPALIEQYVPETAMMVATFHTIGNLAMAGTAEVARTQMVDLSDPEAPKAIVGGFFEAEDRDGDLAHYYFSNIGGEYALFARKSNGGGPVVYDLREVDPPTYVSDAINDDGSGGYVFRQNEHLFMGDSNFASVYDFSDPTQLSEIGRIQLTGDLDTLTPIGNVAVASVDKSADDGQSTAVVPWSEAPDTIPPAVRLHSPEHATSFQPETTRIGLSFDEMVEGKTVFEGSFRVVDEHGQRVDGSFNTQENIVNFTPSAPLASDTLYWVWVPPGGIQDLSGNPITEELIFGFSTGTWEDPR